MVAGLELKGARAAAATESTMTRATPRSMTARCRPRVRASSARGHVSVATTTRSPTTAKAATLCASGEDDAEPKVPGGIEATAISARRAALNLASVSR